MWAQDDNDDSIRTYSNSVQIGLCRNQNWLTHCVKLDSFGCVQETPKQNDYNSNGSFSLLPLKEVQRKAFWDTYSDFLVIRAAGATCIRVSLPWESILKSPHDPKQLMSSSHQVWVTDLKRKKERNQKYTQYQNLLPVRSLPGGLSLHFC